MSPGQRSPHRVAILATALLLAATSAATAHAGPSSYGSNGVFGVSTNPRVGWATATIQPGRYQVDQAPSAAPYPSAPGFWFRCRDFPCGPSFPNNLIASGAAERDISTYMDILPGDVAVSLANVTLTVAN